MSFQWTEWAPTSSSTHSAITVQATLFRNGSIVLSYLSLFGSGSRGEDASIGIQYGVDGVSLSYLRPTLHSGLCYHLYPNMSRCKNYLIEKYECPENTLIVPKCPPGRYLGANLVCLECRAGTYQTGEGMMVRGNCTACAAGKFSSLTGGTSEESCKAINHSNTSLGEELDSRGLLNRCVDLQNPTFVRYAFTLISNTLDHEECDGLCSAEIWHEAWVVLSPTTFQGPVTLWFTGTIISR